MQTNAASNEEWDFNDALARLALACGSALAPGLGCVRHRLLDHAAARGGEGVGIIGVIDGIAFQTNITTTPISRGYLGAARARPSMRRSSGTSPNKAASECLR